MSIIRYYDDYVIKIFGDKMKYRREKGIYELLDGMEITPKLLECGDNYIKIERYETTLEDLILNGNITREQFYDVYEKIVKILHKLDKLCIKHNDIAIRNIVCRNNLKDIAIIDFERAIVGTKDENINNFDCQFYENFSVVDVK